MVTLADNTRKREERRAPGVPIKLVVGAVAAVAIFATLNGCWYTVNQSELANVRRFGSPLYDRSHPVGPGLHFKMPWIDTVDTVQISLRTLHIPPFDVLTVDNQKVTLDLNFNYTVDPNQVYHLLYEVGSSGNVDIDEQIMPVVRDRAARVFADENMVTVNANREAIQAKVEKYVSTAAESLFGIHAHSLQIAAITPSPNFMKSIDEATMAKNEAIKAQNVLNTRTFEAQQAAAVAKGKANAAIEEARGVSQSIKLKADADKYRIEAAAAAEKDRLTLEGQGQQANFADQIAAFGSPEKYNQYLTAKAMTNWTGSVPQVTTGSGNGANLILPLPALK